VPGASPTPQTVETNQPKVPVSYEFWPATIRSRPLQEHVAAAVAGGFTSLAISPSTYYDALDTGMSAQDVRNYAADRGVPLRHLDSLTTWAPASGSFDDEMDDDLRLRWRMSVDSALEICDALGLQAILACAAYDQGTVPASLLADGFGELCARASGQGVRIDLEPMPFFGCVDLADAWSIVSDAGEPENAGILLDTWHFYKAKPDLELLASLPGRLFRTVQLDDAPLGLVGENLLEDTLNHRNFPGHGELPVTEFIRAVFAKGHVDCVGPEVFTNTADQMTSVEVGHIAGRTTFAALRAAGVYAPGS